MEGYFLIFPGPFPMRAWLCATTGCKCYCKLWINRRRKLLALVWWPCKCCSRELATKEVTLVGPQGQHITIVAQEKVVNVSDLSVGDRVAAEYLASLHGEVREPTEEELANPWIVLEDGIIDENPAHPAVGAARQIRAVCSIEAFDAAIGFVMIKDSRGKMHTVEGIPAAKFEGISLGETMVVVYTEALAIAIQKLSDSGM